MRLAVFGATGRIGRIVLELALASGHEARALIRRPEQLQPVAGLAVTAGDLHDPGAVYEVIAGVDAVIAAVGPRQNIHEEAASIELGMQNIVQAMEAARVVRLIALSGAAVDVPGDQKPTIDRIASKIVRRVARHVVDAKQREYAVFATSSLDWTALRPPLVRDGNPEGYELGLRLRPGARVTRADVAQALLDQVADDGYHRLAPFVLPRPRN